MEDSRWAKRAWDDPYGHTTYSAPAGSPEDVKCRAAVQSVREHGPNLEAMSAAHPQPRFTGMPRRALGIRDVVSAVRRPMTSTDFSGQPGGFMGSLRNVLTPFG